MLLTSRPATPAAPSAARTGAALALRGATFGYRGRPVLRDVDLTLQPGEVLAVRGPNGAGKSTLVRGLLGLADLLAGEVELFGQPAGQFRDRHRIGYVPQRSGLGGGIPVTVRELVSSGRLARVGPWRRFGEADRCAVDCALDGVGLAGSDRRPVAELSGGQQRRALVARALAGDPELLVLDEPTAGVDADAQRVLAATLAGLAATGTAVLVVVHETGPLAPVITRTVTLGAAAGGTGC